MNEIVKEGKKSQEHKNIKTLYESWKKVIKLFDCYSRIVYEAKYKIKDKGLIILTPKQMLERLPIVIAQVKARYHFWKFTKWNQTNNILFVLCKRNY